MNKTIQEIVKLFQNFHIQHQDSTQQSIPIQYQDELTEYCSTKAYIKELSVHMPGFELFQIIQSNS